MSRTAVTFVAPLGAGTSSHADRLNQTRVPARNLESSRPRKQMTDSLECAVMPALSQPPQVLQQMRVSCSARGCIPGQRWWGAHGATGCCGSTGARSDSLRLDQVARPASNGVSPLQGVQQRLLQRAAAAADAAAGPAAPAPAAAAAASAANAAAAADAAASAAAARAPRRHVPCAHRPRGRHAARRPRPCALRVRQYQDSVRAVCTLPRWHFCPACTMTGARCKPHRVIFTLSRPRWGAACQRTAGQAARPHAPKGPARGGAPAGHPRGRAPSQPPQARLRPRPTGQRARPAAGRPSAWPARPRASSAP